MESICRQKNLRLQAAKNFVDPWFNQGQWRLITVRWNRGVRLKKLAIWVFVIFQLNRVWGIHFWIFLNLPTLRFFVTSSKSGLWRHRGKKIFFFAKHVMLYTVEFVLTRWLKITLEPWSENVPERSYLWRHQNPAYDVTDLEKNIFFQNMSCYIPLNSYWQAD